MNDYLNSIKARDPAAKSILSIILTYPGVKAVLLHRIANFFHIAGFHLIARIISQTSRFFTVSSASQPAGRAWRSGAVHPGRTIKTKQQSTFLLVKSCLYMNTDVVVYKSVCV